MSPFFPRRRSTALAAGAPEPSIARTVTGGEPPMFISEKSTAGGRTAREPAVLAAHAGERLLHPPSPVGYAYQLYAVTGWTSLRWLRTIPHRTLVVAGGDDPCVPLRNGRMLASRLPDARLHVVPGQEIDVEVQSGQFAGAVAWSPLRNEHLHLGVLYKEHRDYQRHEVFWDWSNSSHASQAVAGN